MKISIKDKIRLFFKRMFSKDVKILFTYKRKSDEVEKDYVVNGRFINENSKAITAYAYADGESSGGIKSFLTDRIKKIIVL